MAVSHKAAVPPPVSLSPALALCHPHGAAGTSFPETVPPLGDRPHGSSLTGGTQGGGPHPAPPAPSPVMLSPNGDAATRRGTAGPQIHRETSVLPFPLHMHQAGDSLPSQVPVPSRINISVGTSSPARQRGGCGGDSVCVRRGEKTESASDRGRNVKQNN